jgi:thiol:disulfide interchange protein DsbD
LAAPAFAQRGKSAQSVQVSATAGVSQVKAGDGFAVGVVFDHKAGWHVQSQDQSFEGQVPTSIKVEVKGGQAGPIQWPEAKELEVDFGSGAEVITVFEGRAIAYVPIRANAKADPDAKSSVEVTLTVRYQVCNDTTCEMPQKETFTASVPVGATTEALVAAADFGAFDAGVFAMPEVWQSTPPTPAVTGSSGGTGEGAKGQPAAPIVPATSPSTAPRSFFGIPLPQSSGLSAILVLLALAALGGLILNLTPCVLPVIPIKVMTLTQHAGSPSRTLYLGLWMATGVVAFWLALGVPVLFVSSFGDPSRIFGVWWVTFGLGGVIVAMALGMMGLFSLNLPQGVYMVNPKADTAWGSFLFGVMTAVLGLPCFGFVAGALLAAAATLPKVATLAIFLGLGVGMALPYLVLAMKPGLLSKLPRTGPASDLVKQVMGMLLLGAGLYFVGSGLIALVAQMPWMGKQLHVWAAAACAGIAGLWLVLRTFAITPSAAKRGLFTIVALVVAGVGVWYASDSTSRARANYKERQAALALAESDAVVSGVWIDYTAKRMEAARAAGKVVVVDFTAEWCFNCKAIKALVLDKAPVKPALAQPDVVLLTADLTSDAAPGHALMAQLGQTGIPLLAIYSPGQDQPWLANAYTSDQVIAALDRARTLATAR